MGCRRTDVVPGLIGNVLPPRGLRFPQDDWGTTSVICGKTQFSREMYVPDGAERVHWADLLAHAAGATGDNGQ